jgi:spore cortex biosynthesis protein YabQ
MQLETAVSASVWQELTFAGNAACLGAMLFFLYDLLRVFRRLILHSLIWISVEDLVYWIVFTGAVFRMMAQQNDGRIRGFALIGMAGGMALYYLLFGRMFLRIAEKITKIIRKRLKSLRQLITIGDRKGRRIRKADWHGEKKISKGRKSNR